MECNSIVYWWNAVEVVGLSINSLSFLSGYSYRNHPLAQESDVVETLHMRLSLLQMTFGKHIERKHVCFFAGEVCSLLLFCVLVFFTFSLVSKRLMSPFTPTSPSDFGRGPAHYEVHPSSAKSNPEKGSTILVHGGWALRPHVHGHGVFQGAHWAHLTGDHLFWCWLPRLHIHFCQ